MFALNAANGNVLWTDVLPILPNSTAGMGAKALNLHFHDGNVAFTTKLFGGTPTYWVSAPDEKVYAINALTGKYELNFSHYNSLLSIAGNNPNTVYNGRAMNLLVDQNRGIVVTSMLSSSSNNAARCFFRGFNILVNPPQLIWTAFCSPPQPGSNVPVDPNWDVNQVNSMTGAWVFKGYGVDNPGGYGGPEGAVNLKTLSPSVKNADGSVGGFCSEMFLCGLEIGNLVNPMTHSVDVGFGYERLYQMVCRSGRVDGTDLFRQELDPVSRDHYRTLSVFYEQGIGPGNKGRNYVCRRLIRRYIRLNPESHNEPFSEWIGPERSRMDKSLREGRRFYRRNSGKSNEFWWETFGVMPDELGLLTRP